MSKDGGSYNKLKENLPAINASLAKFFDGNDPIRMGLAYHGFPRSGGKRGSRVVPKWALNKKAMRKILLRSFPRMNEISKKCENDHRYCRCPFHQHWLAARWAYISYLYWQKGATRGDIASDLNQVDSQQGNPKAIWNTTKIRLILYHLTRAAKGLRSSRPGRSNGKIGRPKKIRETTPASNREGETNGPRSDS